MIRAERNNNCKQHLSSKVGTNQWRNGCLLEPSFPIKDLVQRSFVRTWGAWAHKCQRVQYCDSTVIFAFYLRFDVRMSLISLRVVELQLRRLECTKKDESERLLSFVVMLKEKTKEVRRGKLMQAALT